MVTRYGRSRTRTVSEVFNLPSGTNLKGERVSAPSRPKIGGVSAGIETVGGKPELVLVGKPEEVRKVTQEIRKSSGQKTASTRLEIQSKQQEKYQTDVPKYQTDAPKKDLERASTRLEAAKPTKREERLRMSLYQDRTDAEKVASDTRRGIISQFVGGREYLAEEQRLQADALRFQTQAAQFEREARYKPQYTPSDSYGMTLAPKYVSQDFIESEIYDDVKREQRLQQDYNFLVQQQQSIESRAEKLGDEKQYSWKTNLGIGLGETGGGIASQFINLKESAEVYASDVKRAPIETLGKTYDKIYTPTAKFFTTPKNYIAPIFAKTIDFTREISSSLVKNPIRTATGPVALYATQKILFKGAGLVYKALPTRTRFLEAETLLEGGGKSGISSLEKGGEFSLKFLKGRSSFILQQSKLGWIDRKTFLIRSKKPGVEVVRDAVTGGAVTQGTYNVYQLKKSFSLNLFSPQKKILTSTEVAQNLKSKGMVRFVLLNRKGLLGYIARERQYKYNPLAKSIRKKKVQTYPLSITKQAIYSDSEVAIDKGLFKQPYPQYTLSQIDEAYAKILKMPKYNYGKKYRYWGEEYSGKMTYYTQDITTRQGKKTFYKFWENINAKDTLTHELVHGFYPKWSEAKVSVKAWEVLGWRQTKTPFGIGYKAVFNQKNLFQRFSPRLKTSFEKTSIGRLKLRGISQATENTFRDVAATNLLRKSGKKYELTSVEVFSKGTFRQAGTLGVAEAELREVSRKTTLQKSSRLPYPKVEQVKTEFEKLPLVGRRTSLYEKTPVTIKEDFYPLTGGKITIIKEGGTKITRVTTPSVKPKVGKIKGKRAQFSFPQQQPAIDVIQKPGKGPFMNPTGVLEGAQGITAEGAFSRLSFGPGARRFSPAVFAPFSLAGYQGAKLQQYPGLGITATTRLGVSQFQAPSLKQTPFIDYSIIQTPDQTYRQVTRLDTPSLITTTTPGGGITAFPTYVPPGVFPFTLPGGAGLGQSYPRASGKSKRKYQYEASLVGIEYRDVLKPIKAPKGVITGIGVRPIRR